MSKHTPGPWKWVKGEEYSSYMPMLKNDAGDLVCDFGNSEQYYPTEGTPPNEADSALIAAAPDLLEACKLVVEHAYSEMPRKDWAPIMQTALHTARAAIAKAEEPK